MKEFYRKPYLYDDYEELMSTDTNEGIREGIASIRKFEFLKPYTENDDGVVEDDYSLIANKLSIPEDKIWDLYLLKGEDNFTLDYKRYHPPNKSHITPDIPDPWGKYNNDIRLSPYPNPEPPIVPNSPINIPVIHNPNTEEKEKGMGHLHWKDVLINEVERSEVYEFSVFNGYTYTNIFKEGNLTSNNTQYRYPLFSLKKLSAESNGVEIEQLAFNKWYNSKDPYLFNLVSKGVLIGQPTTLGRVIVKDDAKGPYKLSAKDSYNKIDSQFNVEEEVVFGIMTIPTDYWLTFDKNLNYLGPALLSAYAEDTQIDEDIYQHIYDMSNHPIVITGITKNGSYIVGPYNMVIAHEGQEENSGSGCEALIGPDHDYQGSINGHSLFIYFFIDYDNNIQRTYLYIKDVSILLQESTIQGWYLIGATFAYSDYACLMTFGLNNASCTLYIMDVEGNYKSVDLSSYFTWGDGDSYYSYLTFEGIRYQVIPQLKRIK